MENVTFIKITGINGVEVEHAIIDKGNDEFTSMPKSVYDTLPSNSSDLAEKPKK